VLFTYKNGNLYAITPRWPDGELRLKGVVPDRNMVVTLLETGEELAWQKDGNTVVITVPGFHPNRMKSQYASVFRLSDIEPTDK
jgi:alpha-L-fucosidase